MSTGNDASEERDGMWAGFPPGTAADSRMHAERVDR
jgi:hypothetical protein